MTETETITSEPPRRRSVRSSLLAIVVASEAFIVFFVSLTVFGLDIWEPQWAFGIGGLLIVLLLGVSRYLDGPRGRAVGWFLQFVLVLSGLVLPAMFLVGAVVLGFWIYCYVVGTRLDRRRAAQQADPVNGAAASASP